jgi:hypothetical protein
MICERWWLEKKWIEVYFKVLTWHVRGQTKQTEENLNEISKIL